MNYEDVIVVAEKSETNGTRTLFRQLFNISFRSDENIYETRIDNKPVKVVYMKLAEMRNNNNNNELENINCWNVRVVLCSEYCNPRMQEIDQNLRQLRGMFDVDKIFFVFQNGGDVNSDKSNLVRQMEEYLECRYIQNLDERVFLIERDREQVKELIRQEIGAGRVVYLPPPIDISTPNPIKLAVLFILNLFIKMYYFLLLFLFFNHFLNSLLI